MVGRLLPIAVRFAVLAALSICLLLVALLVFQRYRKHQQLEYLRDHATWIFEEDGVIEDINWSVKGPDDPSLQRLHDAARLVRWDRLWVSIRNEPSAEQMRLLATLPRLEVLNLCTVQHDVLAKLDTLPELQELYFCHGFDGAHFAAMPRLVGLDALGTPRASNTATIVRWAAENAPNLDWIDLCESDLDDAGLEYVARLKHLECLLVYDSQVTALGMEHLREHECLEFVNAHRTPFARSEDSDQQEFRFRVHR